MIDNGDGTHRWVITVDSGALEPGNYSVDIIPIFTDEDGNEWRFYTWVDFTIE